MNIGRRQMKMRKKLRNSQSDNFTPNPLKIRLKGKPSIDRFKLLKNKKLPKIKEFGNGLKEI